MTAISPSTNNPLGLACRDWSNPDYYQSVAPLLFLACPYSDPSITVREERCAAASRVAARLMEMGYAVYSPVSHGHAIANYGMGVGTEYEAWAKVNDPILRACDAIVVLGANTWDSRGVAHEVHSAEHSHIPINIIAERDGRIELLLPDADASMWPDPEDRS